LDNPFETYRAYMFAIAYRMLGSAMEAEDILQEAYLRYQHTPPESIRSPKAFLSAVVTRLCLNQLESARVRREQYIGPWLPEPIAADPHTQPGAAQELGESLSMAFLVLLESLTPVERAVFLLHEVFSYDYAEIAGIVDKEEAACRQVLSRARKHITDHRPRFQPTPEEHRHLLDRFTQAVGQGDLHGLMELLTEDVRMWADGGGKARGAAIRPLAGREAVARFILASTRLPDESYTFEVNMLNGEPALVLRTRERTLAVVFIQPEAGRIKTVRVIGNPDKLKRV
jgi:RNA polymerase sigma-70 factor (ECF subfamily)